MPALNFQRRFADQIKTGAKFTTIRVPRKRPIQEGDRLYLYTGMRTRDCIKLGETEVFAALRIEIGISWFTFLDGPLCGRTFGNHQSLSLIARWDGFGSWEEMVGWLSSTHNLPRAEGHKHWPFVGDWICWSWFGDQTASHQKRRIWNKHELEVLRRDYADTLSQELADRMGRPLPSVYNKAHALGLRKSEAYLASADACRLRRGDNVGAASRFSKGSVPWNKGKSFHPRGRSTETQFKPGQRPATWVPVGTEVCDADGYLKRKIRDDAPIGMSRRNWRYVHIMLWENTHGPVPRGHAVVFRNGDKADIRIENLELVTRRKLMLRNTVHNLPKPLAEVIQLRGALQRQINKRQRSRIDEKQDSRST